jgi:hypothetical protein
MKKFIALAFTALALTVVATSGASAASLDLAKAKALGLVGEQQNGLIGAVSPTPDSDVQALVKETNEGRSAIYKEMAAKQRIEVFQVQNMAAQKLFSAEKAGNYIKDGSSWVKKQ